MKRLVVDRSLGRSFASRQDVNVVVMRAAPVTASYLIGYKLQLTPLRGYCDFINPSTDCGGPVDWLHSMILP